MRKVIPYEHRGKQYRNLAIHSHVDAVFAAKAFREEEDIWLKKLLALKLVELPPSLDVGIPEAELLRVIQCRIN